MLFRLHILNWNFPVKQIQNGGLCRPEWICFPSCDFSDSFFHPARTPGVSAGRPPFFSHASPHAVHSQPCLLTLQSWQIKWIYLVFGGRLNWWLETGEHSCLSRGTEMRKRRQWWWLIHFCGAFKLLSLHSSSHTATSQLDSLHVPRSNNYLVRTACFTDWEVGWMLISCMLGFIRRPGYLNTCAANIKSSSESGGNVECIQWCIV